jgi:hypothetical protein
VFVVRLPKDHPKTEVTWTLSIRGRTESIPANLSDLYMIDALKQIGGTTEGTVPPGLRFDPSSEPAVGPAGITATLETAAARPLPLTVWLVDRTSDASPRNRSEASSPLTVIWSKYRGAGEARFDNMRPPVEQGKASTTVTFPEPGEYVLRVAALRGSGFRGQCCWTNGYVHVKVGPGGDKR